jgi:hypothetical protein
VLALTVYTDQKVGIAFVGKCPKRSQIWLTNDEIGNLERNGVLMKKLAAKS